MLITKAIEIICSIKHVCRDLLPPDEQQALTLAIQALKEKLERLNRGEKC